MYIYIYVYVIFFRTAGSVLGAGFQSFISDWDKVSAAVSRFDLAEHPSNMTYERTVTSSMDAMLFLNMKI